MWEGQTTKFYNYLTGGELGSSFKLTYPFTGCPWCGAWWCTGPLDANVYPKVDQSELFPAFMRALNGRIMAVEAEIKELRDLERIL